MQSAETVTAGQQAGAIAFPKASGGYDLVLTRCPEKLLVTLPSDRASIFRLGVSPSMAQGHLR